MGSSPIARSKFASHLQGCVGPRGTSDLGAAFDHEIGKRGPRGHAGAILPLRSVLEEGAPQCLPAAVADDNAMLNGSLAATAGELRLFTKDTLLRGQPARIECVEILGQTYTITRGPLTIISLEDDWFEDVAEPEAVIAALKDSTGLKPDIFTFWQRLPHMSRPSTPSIRSGRNWRFYRS